MPLPDVTHLQILLLAALADGERSGRELRELLEKQGERKSGPAFYQLMARMEDAGLVTGWYTQKVVDGQIIKERNYKITGAGRSAYHDARDFYLSLESGKLGLGVN